MSELVKQVLVILKKCSNLKKAKDIVVDSRNQNIKSKCCSTMAKENKKQTSWKTSVIDLFSFLYIFKMSKNDL